MNCQPCGISATTNGSTGTDFCSCNAGFSGPSGRPDTPGAACTACSDTEIAPTVGMESCEQCPPDGISINQSTFCFCPPTFWSEEGTVEPNGICFKCKKHPERCLGGSTCLLGYENVGCGQCAKLPAPYFRMGEHCNPCPEPWLSGTAYTVVSILVMLAVFWSFYSVDYGGQ